MADSLDTSKIKEWRSIVTLIVFILTNSIWNALSALRIVSPRPKKDLDDDCNGKIKPYVRFNFPMNFVTAPLVADLFLLAILAIGREEVHDGTLGADNIEPIDIMAFFLSLAYIAISLDASGLIRYLAFKVLQWGGTVGHKLFFYLYAFFFGLASFIGNDPIILSGTAFLAYMTRVSSNIVHPRAWIHTQFAVANIASAILVSSNPTNLVLAGAFNITFVKYTVNIIVPVVVTGIVLFPFLLYIVFASEPLIPVSIKMHELPQEARERKPVNPNIPHARGTAAEEERNLAGGDEHKLLSLEEIMNPFLDKKGAAFGAIIMATTLITLLALNAASQKTGIHAVFWVTLPAAVVMFCWDVGFGWIHRHETREIARKGRQEVEQARAERAIREEVAKRATLQDNHDSKAADIQVTPPNSRLQNRIHPEGDQTKAPSANGDLPPTPTPALFVSQDGDDLSHVSPVMMSPSRAQQFQVDQPQNNAMGMPDEKQQTSLLDPSRPSSRPSPAISDKELNEKERELDPEVTEDTPRQVRNRSTLVSLSVDAYRWSQETFPTATTVFTHLPYALVPFAFSMFVLVQALVTKGWVPVFAYGWDHWVSKTGTVGAIGGMAFLSFAGTNIGTTILLSRVIQSWQQIHKDNHLPISDRTFWATVYSMALGVNYGAFSAAFSASLAGLLWRDILGRKHIRVKRLEFARVNLPIIAIAMTVGCAVLCAEVYIVRDESPYDS
ncbi:MAG: hypothetical protein Q9157_004428 [Trypethelium eluteriae]